MKSKKQKSFVLMLLMLIGVSAYSQESLIDIDKHFENIESSELLMLGTFHFSNPGLDEYKQKHSINMFSDEKQKELMEVLNQIKKFAPTKIAVEVSKSRQGRIDSLYNAYLAGEFDLRVNEIYQVGFRLAKMLGHQKVYAIDARPKDFSGGMTEEEYDKKQNYFINKASPQMLQREQLIDETFMALYEKRDELKTKVSLLDFFLIENDPRTINAGHGHYLIGSFKMGEGNDYFGPDNAMWWYNRNMRIFHNLLQINEPGKDKIFLIIGSGHLPILKFLADASVDFDQVEFKEVVGRK